MDEQRAIKGYEGSYTINRAGEVVSVERSTHIDNGKISRTKECKMRTWFNSSGDLVVQLCRKSQRQIHKVETLIYDAFKE